MATLDLIKSFLCLGAMLGALALIDGAAGEDFFPRASDLSWISFNFKTILKWGPKPSNYSYTVEFSELGQDRQRNPNCIRSLSTDCDLTNDLDDLKATYLADVLSEPLRGETSDLVEFPYTSAPRFTPYTDTLIGRVQFHLEMMENNTGMRVLITDPLTPLRSYDGKLRTIRDVFKQDLKYKIRYNKATSTGKRELDSEQSQVEVLKLDQDENYCFKVAAYIPSRPANKLGQWSETKCSSVERKTILQEVSTKVLAGAIFIMASLLILIITLLVLCCRHCCCKPAKSLSTEGLDMANV